MKSLIKFILIFLALIAVTLGISFMQQPQHKTASPPRPWQIKVMPDGNPTILGIHLGKTDYQTACKIIGDEGEIRLFSKNKQASSLEAYFDSSNFGGLTAKLILNIAVPAQQLTAMLNRSQSGKIQPSGAHQHKLSIKDLKAINSLTVSVLTYIPRVSLTPDMIKYRFGQPATITHHSANKDKHIEAAEIWHYPKKFLTVTFAKGNKTVLIYQAK